MSHPHLFRPSLTSPMLLFKAPRQLCLATRTGRFPRFTLADIEAARNRLDLELFRSHEEISAFESKAIVQRGIDCTTLPRRVLHRHRSTAIFSGAAARRRDLQRDRCPSSSRSVASRMLVWPHWFDRYGRAGDVLPFLAHHQYGRSANHIILHIARPRAHEINLSF